MGPSDLGREYAILETPNEGSIRCIRVGTLAGTFLGYDDVQKLPCLGKHRVLSLETARWGPRNGNYRVLHVKVTRYPHLLASELWKEEGGKGVDHLLAWASGTRPDRAFLASCQKFAGACASRLICIAPAC